MCSSADIDDARVWNFHGNDPRKEFAESKEYIKAQTKCNALDELQKNWGPSSQDEESLVESEKDERFGML